MKLEEILTGAGLDEDAVKQVLDQMKSNKIYTAGEENLDIRYGKLKEQSETDKTQLTEAQKLIDELKAGTADSEAMQSKVSEYEKTVAELQAKLIKTKADKQLQVAILEAGGDDVEYLSYKIQHTEGFAIGEDGEIKDIDNLIKDVKTACPKMFKKKEKDDFKPLEPTKDTKPVDGEVTQEQFNKMSYSKRLEIYNDNPELYKKLNGGK